MNDSRRKFIRTMLGTCAGLITAGPLTTLTGCAPSRLMRTDRTFRRVLADLHVHSAIDKWNDNTPLGVRYPLVADIADKFINVTGMDWKACYEAGVDVICATHFNVFDEWLSMPTDPYPGAAASTYRMMDRLEEELQGEAGKYARLVKNHKELSDALSIPKSDRRFRIAVVHTVEGGHSLGGSLEPLESMAKRGVALMTITHFFNKGIAASANSYPYFPDAGAPWANQGLSEFGRDVVKEMERLGMIVDINHLVSTGVEEILKIAKKPLAVSHASVHTLGDHPLSLYDEHIQEIAAKDGILAVIIYPYIQSNYVSIHEAKKHGNLRDIVRTIRYLVKLCGSHKNIGIGSDFGGYINGPRDMHNLEEIGKLWHMLIEEFGDKKIVEDILANNVIEFLEKNWRTGL